jgi:hypothetical protein
MPFETASGHKGMGLNNILAIVIMQGKIVKPDLLSNDIRLVGE